MGFIVSAENFPHRDTLLELATALGGEDVDLDADLVMFDSGRAMIAGLVKVGGGRLRVEALLVSCAGNSLQ